MSSRYISKRYWGNRQTAMGSSDIAAKRYSDVINLSLGDPDLLTNRIIIEGAFEDACKGHTKYTEFRGDPELRKEIIKYYKEDYQLTFEDEEIFVSTGACVAMYLALEAILNDGDEVLMQSPYFTPYPQQIELARGTPIEIPTYEEENFQINFNRLDNLVTEKTKAIIINSPNNPTGECLTDHSMRIVAEIARKYDLVVISDEIYTAYDFESCFTPFASLPGMRERTITINSFSKNFIMTGWRVGMILGPAEIIQVIREINENVVFTTPSVSQRAAIYALRNRNKIVPPIVEEYKRRMFYAAERINQIGKIHVIFPPKGSFYLFVNIKETGLSSAAVSDLILKKAHVLTLPGSAFGSCGEGYIRLALTVGIEELETAFDRIVKIPELN